LHYNENTAGCSPAVLAALRAITADEVASYPDVAPFAARCARYLGVDPSQVLLTNGLDEGIQVVTSWARRHAPAGRMPHMLLADPAFEMYGEFARMVSANLEALDPEPDFGFPIDALLRAIKPETRAIFLTDPNNPTGIGVPPGMAEAIADAAPDALVLVDEAYADFSGRTLIGAALDGRRNLVVGRTFAKGHGLAGLRIGALVGHHETIRSLAALLPPFNVNIAALRALDAALADRAYLEWYVAEAAASRQHVYDF
jgi:histidinol-phosphate aminotransferase